MDPDEVNLNFAKDLFVDLVYDHPDSIESLVAYSLGGDKLQKEYEVLSKTNRSI